MGITFYFKLGASIKSELDLKATKVSLGNYATAGSVQVDLGIDPSQYSANTPNLKINKTGDALEFVHNNFNVDGEFRGNDAEPAFHRPFLQITAGDEHDITNINENKIHGEHLMEP